MRCRGRARLGDIPVTVFPGHAESDVSDLLEDEKNAYFLPKPLNIKTLAERVKMSLRAE